MPRTAVIIANLLASSILFHAIQEEVGTTTAKLGMAVVAVSTAAAAILLTMLTPPREGGDK